MEKLRRMAEGDYTTLTKVLFGLASSTPLTPDLEQRKISDLEFFDPALNCFQQDAVKFALESTEVALIHGPPGVRLISPLQMALTNEDRPVKHIRSLS